ncbi:MAG: hypothetical protein PHU62_07480 [Bacteroidales bacterium]|nr:hypothetical protein [Bacteroidales bacterium]MDD2205029.1 hypothetical protein [Bacteroidales bacterium]MDD3151499.1 hypothetical protein [Bacteroidales bacterium]MDD3914506.1 hypothetical protein [Bacteroidales bacterium]MDD4634394.1 hypothetical protein [Bacteroidales bacterium]
MKVLILSCDTGEGHNSAAHAFLEYLQICHIDGEIADTLGLISTNISQKASDLYVFSTRTSLFKVLYKAGELVSDTNRNKIKSPVYLANKLYCDKLLDYIIKNGYDAIVCTHIFPAEALTALRRAKKLVNVPILFIMTDYTSIPFIEETELDYYIAPHEHLIEECVQKGIPRNKLYPYGIPVKQCFYARQPKMPARMECKELFGNNIDENKYWFMIMSGSMGFGNIQLLVDDIITKYNVELFLVCGNNKTLKNNLQKRYTADSNINIIGFTDKVAVLMDSCDVLFTKPGGLSSTEAAAKGIPIIHTAPIPGCETRNALFFHYHGMSYSTTDIAEQVNRALNICEDINQRNKMIYLQRVNINPNTCKDILQLLNKKLNETN